MAFTLQNWGLASGTTNAPLQTLDSGDLSGTPMLFTYISGTDALATIVAANYFSAVARDCNVGDIIYCVGTDASQISVVAAVDKTVNPNTISVSVFAAAGVVGTANISDGAVTTAKLAANAVTAAKIANNTVDVAQLALDTIQYVKVPVTAAQFNGMYAAPFVLIAAPGAGKMIVVDNAELVMTFVAAQYAAGGVIALQYDSTVHGAGTAASATIAAATVNAYAASSNIGVAGALGSSAITTVQNKGIYLSNATGAFTTGDGTWQVHIAYRVVTA